MKIIKPSYEIMDEIDGQAILKKLEKCGRVCYKSEDNITYDSAADFINRKILQGGKGHLSVIEHVSITVKFIIDRGVSHELVRHRLASYSQESTRYCNYSKDKFGNEITVIWPNWFTDEDLDWIEKELNEDDPVYSKYTIHEESRKWWCGIQKAEEWYFRMLNNGASPQQARSVLPNSLKTEIIMTANLREWRHVFTMRTSKRAHPQIREVMCPLLDEFKEKIPVIFDDITY